MKKVRKSWQRVWVRLWTPSTTAAKRLWCFHPLRVSSCVWKIDWGMLLVKHCVVLNIAESINSCAACNCPAMIAGKLQQNNSQLSSSSISQVYLLEVKIFSGAQECHSLHDVLQCQSKRWLLTWLDTYGWFENNDDSRTLLMLHTQNNRRGGEGHRKQRSKWHGVTVWSRYKIQCHLINQTSFTSPTNYWCTISYTVLQWSVRPWKYLLQV